MKTSIEIRDHIADTVTASLQLTSAMLYQEVAMEYLGGALKGALKAEGMRRLVDSGITAEQLCYYTDVPHDECQAAIDRYKANPELGKV